MTKTLSPIERMVDEACSRYPANMFEAPPPKPSDIKIQKRFTAICDAAMKWHRNPTNLAAQKLHKACENWLEIGGW